MTNKIYECAAQEMPQILTDNHIPYICQKLYDGYKITFPQICNGDIICHSGSYGHENGLWESMAFPWDEGDVTGHLTTEKFISLLKEHYGI